jgi:hypothetical protein
MLSGEHGRITRGMKLVVPDQRRGRTNESRKGGDYQEVISDHMVELNPTTMDSRTDEAAASVVSDLNVSKWKSYSP